MVDGDVNHSSHTSGKQRNFALLYLLLQLPAKDLIL
jgi:hypothetical protein